MYVYTSNSIQQQVNGASVQTTRIFHNRLVLYDVNNAIVAYITDFKSCTATQNATGDEKLSMGSAVSAELSTTFIARNEGNITNINNISGRVTTPISPNFNYKGRKIVAQCGIQRNITGNISYIDVGTFYIDEAITDDNGVTITVRAYDILGTDLAQTKFSYTPTSSETVTAKSIINYIGTQLSMSVVFNLMNTTYDRTITEEELTSLQGLTYREVLGIVAGLLGCNVKVTNSNKLLCGWFNTNSVTAQDNYTGTPSFYDINIPTTLQFQHGFKKLQDSVFNLASCTSSNNDTTGTYSGDSITFTSYGATAATGITFANKIIQPADIMNIAGAEDADANLGWMSANKTYQPCEVTWRGHPCIEAGDVITAYDKSNTAHTVFIAKQVLNLCGGLKSVITCPIGDAEIAFSSGEYATKQELNRTSTALETALINATNKITGVQGGYVKILDLDSDGSPDTIFLTDTDIKETDIDETTGYIKTPITNQPTKVIRMNNEGIGISSGLNAGTSVNPFKVAMTGEGIVATQITSGTISTDRLSISGIVDGINNAGSGITITQNKIEGLPADLQTLTSKADSAVSDASEALDGVELVQKGLARYLTCSSTASSALKICYLPDTNDFVISTGTTITVKFTYTGYYTTSALDIQLAIRKNNSSENIQTANVYYNGNQLKSNSVSAWSANGLVSFIFDGTNWVMQDNVANTILSDWCMTNNRTYIDGAHIYTGTIQASAIYAGVIAKRSQYGSSTITGNTRFDLDNDLLVTQSNTYRTEISAGEITQYGGVSSSNRIGMFAPVSTQTSSGIDDDSDDNYTFYEGLYFDSANAAALSLGYLYNNIPYKVAEIRKTKNTNTGFLGGYITIGTDSFNGLIVKRHYYSESSGDYYVDEAKFGVGDMGSDTEPFIFGIDPTNSAIGIAWGDENESGLVPTASDLNTPNVTRLSYFGPHPTDTDYYYVTDRANVDYATEIILSGRVASVGTFSFYLMYFDSNDSYISNSATIIRFSDNTTTVQDTVKLIGTFSTTNIPTNARYMRVCARMPAYYTNCWAGVRGLNVTIIRVKISTSIGIELRDADNNIEKNRVDIYPGLYGGTRLKLHNNESGDTTSVEFVDGDTLIINNFPLKFSSDGNLYYGGYKVALTT